MTNNSIPNKKDCITQGLIVRNTGAHYIAELQDGSEAACRVKGNFRIKGIRTTNPVAVGDRVVLSEPSPDGIRYILEILPRENYIIRRASNLSKAAHIIAANIDCALLVVTLAHPTTSTTFIDRFLATAEAYNVQAILAINKIDLLDTPDDRELLDAVAYLYRSIGYPVVCLSAKTGEGVEDLRSILKDKITLLSGNSGVGKSTIINDLVPGSAQRVKEISDVHDQGMHTTTYSEMFTLPDGGRLIDTPGVRGFGTVEFERNEVSHYFPEIFEASKECRFGDCTHTREPGCAVLKAVENSRISESRYNSYLNILTEDASGKEDKYRQ